MCDGSDTCKQSIKANTLLLGAVTPCFSHYEKVPQLHTTKSKLLLQTNANDVLQDEVSAICFPFVLSVVSFFVILFCRCSRTLCPSTVGSSYYYYTNSGTYSNCSAGTSTCGGLSVEPYIHEPVNMGLSSGKVLSIYYRYSLILQQQTQKTFLEAFLIIIKFLQSKSDSALQSLMVRQDRDPLIARARLLVCSHVQRIVVRNCKPL